MSFQVCLIGKAIRPLFAEPVTNEFILPGMLFSMASKCTPYLVTKVIKSQEHSHCAKVTFYIYIYILLDFPIHSEHVPNTVDHTLSHQM